MGWDEHFVRKGRAVYVPDQVTRGRSGFNATVYNEVKLGLRPPSEQPSIGMLSHQFQWGIFRFGPRFNEAFADEQFPVQAVEGLYRQGVPILNSTLGAAGDQPNFQNLAQLAVQVRGAVVAGHSQSGFWPMRAALVNPAGMRGLIDLEGFCVTTLTREQLATLAQIPILVILGDHLADADPVFRDLWLGLFRACETFVQQVNKAGGDATLLHLPDVGIFGNSHMMMQDKNNLEVADVILAWIDQHVEGKHEGAMDR